VQRLPDPHLTPPTDALSLIAPGILATDQVLEPSEMLKLSLATLSFASSLMPMPQTPHVQTFE
jgi:hypothetical protein